MHMLGLNQLQQLSGHCRCERGGKKGGMGWCDLVEVASCSAEGGGRPCLNVYS